MSVLLPLFLIGALILLFYFGTGLYASTAVIFTVLAGWTYFGLSGWFGISFWWVVALAIAVPLNIPALRRKLVSNRVLTLFKKLMPPLSRTEREALEAGTVWWEGDIFGGRPDWKKLHAIKEPELSEEEKAFLNGAVEELCAKIDNWKVTSELYDLPAEVWDFLKKNRFFGMIIPKEYGGLGFSAYGHSEVIAKIASRSTTAAVTVMVPNSLGPAELLMAYGTGEQKDHYLPRLADGTEIPCFALTAPSAGSDASSIPDTGYVMKGSFNGREVTGIRLTFDKRYITLAPVATVMGLAFRLFDPAHLLGEKEDLGITVALVPTDLPGVAVGPRHDPTGTPFLNGTARGENVFIPVEYIVGGAEQVGNGWRMLMERLAIGRSISLPALSVAAAKLSARGVGGYARIRKQFNLPIGKFEGVEERLARIAGYTYMMDAGRKMTLAGVDSGERPALLSAISKYNLTEMMRIVVNDAVDVQGGAAIVMGPRNFLGSVYQGIPVSITVEGANILTRTLIVFGQGVIRAHPWILREMEAAGDQDAEKSASEFDKALFGHIGFTTSNKVRASISAITFGRLLPAPPGNPLAEYYRRLQWMSSAFAFLADASLLILGGGLKRKEKISGRFADVLSRLYFVSAVLKRFEDDGRPSADIPLAKWACEESFYEIQKALDGILNNLPVPVLPTALRLVIFPFGKPFKPPSDRLGHEAADLLLEPSEARDRLTEGIYIGEKSDPLGRIDDALLKVIAAEPLEKKIHNAVRNGEIHSFRYEDRIEEALEKGVLTESEKIIVQKASTARTDVITVDEFPKDYWERRIAEEPSAPSQEEDKNA